jgi:hypothetical protein
MRIQTLCYWKIPIPMIVSVEWRRRFPNCSLSLDRRSSPINVGMSLRVMGLINHLRRSLDNKSHRLPRRKCRKKQRKREDKGDRRKKRQGSLDIARLRELKLRKRIPSKDW